MRPTAARDVQAESDARAALATMCAVWTAPADDAPDAYAEYAADAPLLGSSIVDLFESRAATLGALRLYTWLRTDGSEEASLSYEQMRERAHAVCVALRRPWAVPEQGRVMLIYPPGLELLVAFFGCQYAAVIAVPYYPPAIPASAMPPASARRLLSDGLAKVGRIAASCRPTLFLSTATYIRLKWLSSKVLGAGPADSPTRWPGEWIWKSTDDLSARLAAADQRRGRRGVLPAVHERLHRPPEGRGCWHGESDGEPASPEGRMRTDGALPPRRPDRGRLVAAAIPRHGPDRRMPPPHGVRLQIRPALANVLPAAARRLA